MKKIILLLCICVSFVLSKDYENIKWDDLEGKVEAFDNPFEKLTSDQLYNLSIYARVDDMMKVDESRVKDYLKEEMKEAEEFLEKEKIDIAYYLEQRQIYIKNKINQVEKANLSLDGKDIKISGFSLALKMDAGKIQEFLFVPYFGACIHTPPPPPNQILLVKSNEEIPVRSRFEPITVKGKLNIEKNSTELFLVDGSDNINSTYVIKADSIEKYEKQN